MVVPAQAGTHTPQPIDSGVVVDAFPNNKYSWLWVPAFAGTTARKI